MAEMHTAVKKGVICTYSMVRNLFVFFFFLSLFCNKLPGIHLPTIVPQLLKNIHLCEYFIKKKGCETVLFNRIDTKPSVEMTIEICVVCSNHSGQC